MLDMNILADFGITPEELREKKVSKTISRFWGNKSFAEYRPADEETGEKEGFAVLSHTVIGDGWEEEHEFHSFRFEF